MNNGDGHDIIVRMAIIDTLYDILSGIGGTLFGVAVTTLINRRRNRRLNDGIIATQKKLDVMSAENQRLLGMVRERENRILDLEKQILDMKPKRRAK